MIWLWWLYITSCYGISTNPPLFYCATQYSYLSFYITVFVLIWLQFNCWCIISINPTNITTNLLIYFAFLLIWLFQLIWLLTSRHFTLCYRLDLLRNLIELAILGRYQPDFGTGICAISMKYWSLHFYCEGKHYWFKSSGLQGTSRSSQIAGILLKPEMSHESSAKHSDISLWLQLPHSLDPVRASDL